MLRQIEDYTKYRAPALIVELLMDKLSTFEKLYEDAKVIKKKMEVDNGVEKLEEYYHQIYDLIEEVNGCKKTQEEAIQALKAKAVRIRDMFIQMDGLIEEYETAKEAYEDECQQANAAITDEEREEHQRKAEDARKKMESAENAYKSMASEIEKESKSAVTVIDAQVKVMEGYRRKLKELLAKCTKAEKAKEDLKQKIDELRSSLESGKCSNELQHGLMDPELGEDGKPIDGKSTLDRYEALLKYNIEQMGYDMLSADDEQIARTAEDRMEKAPVGNMLLTDFSKISVADTYPITAGQQQLHPFISESFANYTPDPGRDGDGFTLFENISPECKEFYDELKKIYSNSEGKGADKKNLTKAVTSIFKEAQATFGGLSFEPEGASFLVGGADTSNPSTGTSFGTGSDWGAEGQGKKQLENALDDDFLSKLSDGMSAATNKILLLVYDTEMFSDASTPGSKDEDFPEKNMAGVKLSTEVNYYFQSELEYLYNGNLADAEANLRSVAGMIFLVRFVFDYISSFAINDVNGIVATVKGVLAWTGPFAILAGELARLGLSIGEAAMDVSRLRNGHDVAVFKTNHNWRLSIEGLAEAATEGLSEEEINSAFSAGADFGDDKGVATMSYTDYVRLFLLLVPSSTLASRTRNLIELNVTNYKEAVNAIESKMTYGSRYKLCDAVTDFSLTTTVDLRMLFLSMGFAQSGVNGVVPPRKLPITATDYRGY